MTDSRESRIARLAATGRNCRHVLAALPDWTLAHIDNPEHGKEIPKDTDFRLVLQKLLAIADARRLPGEVGSFHVYRIAFDDGAAYVGMTGRSVLDRIEEHFGATGPRGTPDYHTMPMDERMESSIGTFRIVQRLAAGVACSVEVLASGLTEVEAGKRERREIAKLEKPLNTAGPVRAWSDPLAYDRRIAIMRDYHKRIEHDLPEDPS